jgi:hypothetical protein
LLYFQLRNKKSQKALFAGRKIRRKQMRTMLMSTAAIGLVATLLTVPAYADRVCRKVCHEGFCKSECVSSGPRLYMMHDGDRHYHHHEMHENEMHGSGVGVEIKR